MKTQIDCFPCIFKQLVETSRLAGLGTENIKKIILLGAEIMAKAEESVTPPEMSGAIQAVIQKESGREDIYREIKRKSNELALSFYEKYKHKVERAKDGLLTAVEIAIAGNIIDFGIHHSLEVEKELEKILREENLLARNSNEGFFAIDYFKKQLRQSKVIMFLADNTGETVFDRILIEEIKRHSPGIKIFYAVRGKPILNDALEEDAVMCGIHHNAEILSSSSSFPGTNLGRCSATFLDTYRTADMIISKGQGNFESFTDPDKPVFYLFMAKCVIVAKEAGCNIGDINLFFNNR